MVDDKKEIPIRVEAGYNGKPDFSKLPDGPLELSYNGPPKVEQVTMNVTGQTPPSDKISVSPPPPPKK